MLTYLQEKLIFQSYALPQGHAFQFKQPFKEVFLTAEDGARLHALHFTLRNAKGIILYFHGNRGSVDYWGEWAAKLADMFGYEVVVMDYRGYGKSRGVRRFENMLNDANLFYNYCKTYFPEEKIIVFGRSLGGAFATHSVVGNAPVKLILESTFTNLIEVAQNKYWFLPLKTLIKFPFQNDGNIAQLALETHFIHGTQDQLVYFNHSEKLYRLSGSSQKKMHPIEGGAHNNLREFEVYFKVLQNIL